jgi:nicotinamidase-related amidase
MKTECLVIVDMQPDFKSANDRKTIDNVLIQIEKAREQDIPIFILEFINHGQTSEEIQEALEGYYQVWFIAKGDDDGSRELITCIQDNAYIVNDFIVCGVNICACVYWTIKGLLKDYKTRITVIKDACNGKWSHHIDNDQTYNDYDLQDVYTSDRVSLV